ncbi:FAD-dependent oxidoreductase [Halarsenatibacter silvermanii]|uniref:NADPH-dependent 2,4-dienoyl-CoA reductase, sulfur reductase n=1 Tax=Halarsenatibacter silvermanii TaxID=321763 RepID=A0A1G9HYE4_9FIRM|nr:FAD-dependent oxidoreductase [Halarsenatibacter silvermanii]SDL17988.1 NADPH-dependent 2,4-dienoyl-CoA reductase, sulfur reductase [Halarsenatibacter silvermanii]
MKIVIVGGVAAGTSAAAKASREMEDAEIVILEKDQDISYAGCGLPYYISGVIPERDQLIANYPEEFSEKYGVEVKTGHEVTSLNLDDHRVEYKNLSDNTAGSEDFDRLILATGASPIIPPIPGIDLDNIFTLRRVNDADRIKKTVQSSRPERVTIVGAGLIGLEMAESFAELDMEVTLVEQQEHVLPLIPDELSEKLEDHLRDQEVELVLNDGVSHFSGGEKVREVVTESGRKLATDLVLNSIGISPDTELAAEAGIELGVSDAIRVNTAMETNRENVYACGDCAETVNLVTGKKAWVPLGSTANKQGRTAGTNAAGGEAEHYGVLKTGITKVFDFTVAATGIQVEEAAKAGYDPVPITVKVPNHAGYYPGFEPFSLRGVFDRTSGRLLGAAAVGRDGVDKRIDVLASAIYAGQTADDLFQMDLGYAPPYSTPKDPVAVLGMVAKKKVE